MKIVYHNFGSLSRKASAQIEKEQEKTGHIEFSIRKTYNNESKSY
jgi:hypothetical protein